MLLNTYVFYGDIYFLQNFIIKTAVLFLVFRILRIRQVPIGKILFVSVLANLFEVTGLLLFPSYQVFIALVHLIEVPCIMFFLLKKEKRHLIKAILAGYFFVMIMNSVIEMFWNWYGATGQFLLFVLLSSSIVVLGTNYYLHYRRISKGIWEVDLRYKERRLKTKAYYDSGNQLKDPYTGKGVHIISKKVLAQLGVLDEAKVCIPYQSLGQPDGLLEVYYMDSLRIHRADKEIELHKIPVGATEELLFQGKAYEMILNEEVE